jgi:formate dehydrogenase iron-sulfur subunit
MAITSESRTEAVEPRIAGQEARYTAGVEIRPGTTYGFFTDTTLCIGCKACEVACKEWNSLPADAVAFKGTSYDHTGQLSAYTWRHVAFIEQEKPVAPAGDGRETADGSPPSMPGPSSFFLEGNGPRRAQARWLMMSDVCKHCAHAGCLEACPTGAIIRTEFGTVVVQQDVCNGCGYCVPACPFGVIEVDVAGDGKAHKCTLCYDRLKVGMEPACAKACPTDSIQFGPLDLLRERARRRVQALHERGFTEAYLYGAEEGDPGATNGIEALHCFFLLLDRPNVYNLPERPRLPARNIVPALAAGLTMAAGLLAATIGIFSRRL